MNKNVLHLLTQDDQPYGSVRKCCELCGEQYSMDMIYSDTKKGYDWVLKHRPDKYASCQDSGES